MTVKTALTVSMIKAKILAIIGWFFGVIFLLAVIATLPGVVEGDFKLSTTLVALVLLSPCIYAIVCSWKIKARIKRYKLYVTLISLHDMTSIAELAGHLHKTQEFVKKDLEVMISLRYFDNALYDPKNNEIVISDKSYTEMLAQANKDAPMKEVICENCGGSNRIIVRKVVKCKFCGTFLE